MPFQHESGRTSGLKEESGMNVAIIGGTGYVGLATAVCLASKGNMTYCVGRNEEKIERIRRGFPTVYEDDMEEILKDALRKGNLKPTVDLEEAVLNSSISFMCVGTPCRDDGSIDLSQIREVSEKIGLALGKKKNYHVVVVRSTVIPGTTEDLVIPVLESFSKKKAGADFGVCMNPEFLREGKAMKDFLSPRKIGIVVGELDKRSGDTVLGLYRTFGARIMRTTLKTAEMIKYARNSYLAKDISFANEIANICEKCGTDFLDVKKGMEMDARIGRGRFLEAGAGFGGSCFPKDVRALVAKAQEVDVEPRLLKATLEVNEVQPNRLIELAKRIGGSLKGKKIAVLGLSFKPGTDDMREAPSIKVVNALLNGGANVSVYDPQALGNARKIFGDKITYAKRAEYAVNDADMCLIVTEWKEFAKSKLYNAMRGKIVIDGRRALNPLDLAPGFVYHSIGFNGPVKT
jgi:UDPglucose 6-dehydrogenase